MTPRLPDPLEEPDEGVAKLEERAGETDSRRLAADFCELRLLSLKSGCCLLNLLYCLMLTKQRHQSGYWKR